MQLQNLVFKTEFGLIQQLQELVLSVQPKTNPYSLLAGDDTTSCMGWGSEKNNAYMYTPTCAIFTIQMKRAEGGFRTISQSLLRIDRDIVARPDSLAEMPTSESEIQHLITSAPINEDSQFQLNCDNAEPNKNYQDKEWQVKTRAAYTEFFAIYIRQCADQLKLNPEMVGVGMGYSNAFIGHDSKTSNTYIPAVLIPYSDMIGRMVYKLELGKAGSFPYVIEQEMSAINVEYRDQKPGIRPLTLRDIHAIGCLEKSAYSGSELVAGYSLPCKKELLQHIFPIN